MSVAEIGALHSRYIRLTDWFKASWTFHQYASGVYKNLLNEELPYQIDFQKLYERVKGVTKTLNGAQVAEATAAIDAGETLLQRCCASLLRADDRISPSILRRFFEKLKRQDDNIIHFLIKFYLYADAVEGDRRDKLDFLFTRIGEDFVAERGEYWSRDSAEFRDRMVALVNILHTSPAPTDEVMRVIRAVRSMRDEIVEIEEFEEFGSRNILRNARLFKHRLGDLYFHPDVLTAIVELNVTTKNRFLRLYNDEEQRILEDSQKLMDHGPALANKFGESHPDLVEEIARFRRYKEQFDESRANSNVKHDVIAQLKNSMNNILTQLDRGLSNAEDVEDAPEELPEAFFIQAQQIDQITARFGQDPLLQPFLLRIVSALDQADMSLPPEKILELPGVRDLRLEAWEIAAFEKLFDRWPPEADEDNEDLWRLYVRAGALRLKVDEEATILAASLTSKVTPDTDLLTRAKVSLDKAKELDEEFGEFVHEAVYYSNPKILHQLYRSRFRLLRGFSGLWLIYDQSR